MNQTATQSDPKPAPLAMLTTACAELDSAASTLEVMLALRRAPVLPSAVARLRHERES